MTIKKKGRENSTHKTAKYFQTLTSLQIGKGSYISDKYLIKTGKMQRSFEKNQ